jgi:SAM-dependent methyltransferase
MALLDLCRDAGVEPIGKVWLEIGTGWHPILPFLLHLLGAERVVTVDTHRWMDAHHAAETLTVIGRVLDQIAEHFGVSGALLRERHGTLKRATDLTTLLAAAGVEYRCPVSGSATGLADTSVDVVFSTNVLEHIPPGDLVAVHREVRRVLRPGGVAVHRIDPSDHFAHRDPSITRANFLRFSDAQWSRYGSGLAYHNRLRAAEHVRLLTEAGFRVLLTRESRNTAIRDAIESGTLPVDARFRVYDPEALAVDYLQVAGARLDE